jgi:hypothetical protein
MVNVPAQYDPLIKEMSSSTGIPYDVIAAQANDESSFSATAKSSAGALGWLQFLPSTYNSYAAQAGVGPGSEFNPASEAKVYDVYMASLLKQEKGNLRNALAAYNAGPGNIQAGMGYADKILSEAGQGGTHISTTSASLSNPLGGISVSGVVQGAINAVLEMFGLSSLKDMFERFGIILLGVAILILGLHYLASSGSSPVNVQTSTKETEEGTTTNRKVKHPLGTSTTSSTAKAAEGTGSKAALEAAAVA